MLNQLSRMLEGTRDYDSALTGILQPSSRSAFVQVWGIHLGVYAGAALGLVAQVLVLRARHGRAAAAAAAGRESPES